MPRRGRSSARTPPAGTAAQRPFHPGGASRRTPARLRGSPRRRSTRAGARAARARHPARSRHGRRARRRITRLLPSWASGALPAISTASAERLLGEAALLGDGVDEAPGARRAGVDPAADEEQLARPRGADDVDELADPGVRVDEAELRRRHPERDRRRGDPQVARDRELQPATDRVAVQERRRSGTDRPRSRRSRRRTGARRASRPRRRTPRRADRRCRSRPRTWSPRR